MVAIVATTESGTKVGSGYLLDAAHALTAWHCTVDEAGQLAVALRVERAEGENAAVTVIESTPGLDVALLEVSGDPPWGTELPGGPIVFGQLDRAQDGQIDCDAVGFPQWQASGGFRDVAEVHGPVYLLEDRESRRAVVRDLVLEGVTVDDGSPWAGFSGASVFHNGLLVGVVIEQHPRQGASSLQFRPIGAIADDNGDAERRLARALRIDSPTALRLVTAGSAPVRPDAPTAGSPGSPGWSLSSDREKDRHWGTRARGVSSPGERGWRFRGREQAFSRITDWLDGDRPPTSPRVLVVTGVPGAGKSAVLARVVTTADRQFRASMPPDDTGMMATVGSVSCAVHASGKTALEVAAEIAAAAAVDAPGKPEDLVLAVSERSAGAAPGRFTVLIDALDEAVSTAQAREIIDSVILPLAETCPGVRVVAGTRSRDDEGDLIGRFGRALDLVDLDAPEYFREKDLVDYALAWLQLRGSESPYADVGAARPLAETIARAAGRNFLVAGLVARDYGLHDRDAADPARLELVTSVRAALERYLERLTGVGGLPARRLLTALAFAEAPGLTAALWKAAVEALPQRSVHEAWPVQVGTEQLDAFARSSAANFLVETQGEAGKGGSGGRSYRLFHQALGEALMAARDEAVDRAADEDALAWAFLRDGHAIGWERAPEYLLRSLPIHAARAGMVDKLLIDDEYLLYADLRRLLQVADRAESQEARARARLLGLTPEAVTAGPAERAAMFSMTEAVADLGAAYREHPRPVPYGVRWAAVEPRHETLTLRHPGGWVPALCAVRVGDRTLLASGGEDGRVWLWDPVDGARVRVLEGYTGCVYALCAVQAGDRILLAVGGDRGVGLWDPVDGTEVRVLDDRRRASHTSNVHALCAVQAGDRILLAVASPRSGTVELWDPIDGVVVHLLESRNDQVLALCGMQAGDSTLLAVGGNHGPVGLWDPIDGTKVRVLDDRRRRDRIVNELCAVQAGGRILLAVGNHGAVGLWDPVEGLLVRVLEDLRGGLTAVCTVEIGDRVLLAIAGITDSEWNEGAVGLWDPVDGARVRVLEGYTGRAMALCAVQVGDRTLLAVGSGDETVGLWDLDLYAIPPSGNLQAGPGRIAGVCTVQVGDRVLLAARGKRGVGLWDPVDGAQIRALEGDTGDHARAVCAVQAGDRALLAIAGVTDNFSRGWSEGMVQLWDPADGARVRVLEGDTGDEVRAVCTVQVGDRTLLATAESTYTSVGLNPWSGTVRLWDPVDGAQVRVLESHTGRVEAMCTVQVGADHILLAVGSNDGAVRLWDPVDGAQVRVLESHTGGVEAVCAVQVGADQILLAVGSNDGAVRLWDPVDGTSRLTVPVHHPALALTPVANALAVGLGTGVIAITFNWDALALQRSPSSALCVGGGHS